MNDETKNVEQSTSEGQTEELTEQALDGLAGGARPYLLNSQSVAPSPAPKAVKQSGVNN